MAIRDVKDYYFKMLSQYMEMKGDLADFEQALKDGFITEEQMQAAVKEEVSRIENNYDRLSYIMYLLNLPNRKSKRKRPATIDSVLAAEFKNRKADIGSVSVENRDALKAFKDEMKSLQGE